MNNTGSHEFDQVRRFWQSSRVEQTLVFHDIESSQAHVRMLGETGIISQENATKVLDALEQVRQEWAQGRSFFSHGDQDIHVALERRLHELVGEDAFCLRIAKSRNDQIATDLRLWLRDGVFDDFALLLGLRQTLIELAARDLEVIMPGYSHMQPGTPILLAHWWLANEERFRRDFDRLIDFYRRFNALPMGAGAGAGTNEPIDRNLVAQYLGFDTVIDNSLDAVSDRDYLVEFGAFASLVGIHVSQLSSEIMLWTTQEFGFARLRKAFTFRSQSMPQKKNPALLEILRSRPSVIFGRLVEFLNELKGLPVGYSQDLQESVPSLMELVDSLKFILELTTVLVPAVEFDHKRMREMASADLTNAANALDFLHSRGIEPDKASSIIEALVNYCEQRNKYLSDLELNEWQQFCPAFDPEIYKHVTIEESVGSRVSSGGTSEIQVSQALDRARQLLTEDRQRLPQRAAQRLNIRELESI
jgi:argininosuccinate lyase